MPLPNGGLLLVGQSRDSLDDLRELLGYAFAWAGAAVLLLGLLTSFLIAKALLGRLDGINRTADRIIDGRLADRVPEGGRGDEFDRLARNLNRMLDRIQRLMEGLRQVSSDIAHDLRTPLSRLRQRLEGSSAGASFAAYQEVIDRAISETDAPAYCPDRSRREARWLRPGRSFGDRRPASRCLCGGCGG